MTDLLPYEIERLEGIERAVDAFLRCLEAERALNWDDYPEHPTKKQRQVYVQRWRRIHASLPTE